MCTGELLGQALRREKARLQGVGVCAHLGGGGHGGDKDTLDAERREEGVQVARKAEGHRLAALQHAALVVDRVEVDLECLARCPRKQNLVRRAAPDQQHVRQQTCACSRPILCIMLT